MVLDELRAAQRQQMEIHERLAEGTNTQGTPIAYYANPFTVAWRSVLLRRRHSQVPSTHASLKHHGARHRDDGRGNGFIEIDGDGFQRGGVYLDACAMMRPQQEDLPSRPETIRRLVQQALKGRG
jgi:hypothetical protein